MGRDEQSGVIYLTNKNRFDLALGARRIEAIQRGVVNYFVSRDEDNQRMMMMMAQMGRYGHGAVAAPNAVIRRPQQLVVPGRGYPHGFY